jgi:RNA polymerase sigma-70 factor (ECF subfamily)
MAHTDEPKLKAWMLAACDGDSRATAQLLQALAPRLRAFFRAKGCSVADAEDLVQETLIAVHTKRAMYDPAQPLLAWVYAIARYRLIDAWRRTGRRGVAVPVDDYLDILASEQTEAGDPSRDVATLLGQLPDKQRRAIELVKLSEHSVREAAGITGWSESDIKVSVHRGLKALSRLVAGARP